MSSQTAGIAREDEDQPRHLGVNNSGDLQFAAGHPVADLRTGIKRKRRVHQSAWEGVSVWKPMSWPTWLRRTFLLTFPIAILSWLTILCGWLVLAVVRDFGRPIKRFWTAAPKRRTRYYYVEKRD